MKKISLLVLSLIASTVLTSCFLKKAGDDTITVVSREASSGTRTTFDEMTGVAVRQGNEVKDSLFSEALISGSSGSVGMTVANEPNAIGYTSLASAGSAPKILSVNGVMPSLETVSNGTYPLHRPFLMVLGEAGKTDALAQDFVNFVSSKEGQEIVSASGYVPVRQDAPAFSPAANLSGKIVLSGSTSVEPVMAKLQEGYKNFQPNVQLEVQYVGSTAGLKDVASQKAQIGLSSRDLTAEELTTLQAIPFAHDAIAVIVNKKNPLNDITTAQLKSVYTGETRNWSALTGSTTAENNS